MSSSFPLSKRRTTDMDADLSRGQQEADVQDRRRGTSASVAPDESGWLVASVSVIDALSKSDMRGLATAKTVVRLEW
ncbi:hypothetical protein, partial [Rhodococcus wratislaviensis]|uniref:hypothetical protein n=1 Tax=Rhodococcus wratislaviensis TaxID=44752 RepID=UPI00364D7E03